jgi:hypothetical protein
MRRKTQEFSPFLKSFLLLLWWWWTREDERTLPGSRFAFFRDTFWREREFSMPSR